MAARVVLDRDPDFTLNLTQDGDAPKHNAITKAELVIPGDAFDDGNSMTVDTDGAHMSLINYKTDVKVDLSTLDLTPGLYRCYLFVYDAVHTRGIPWDTVDIEVATWPAST